jgi:exodeoxyribonuclease VIII
MLDEVHVMVDTETWGTGAGCAIRSIGAVVFCPETGNLGTEFYINVADDSCERVGLVKDAGTVAWWARQSKAAQDSLLTNPAPIEDALAMFSAYWLDVKGEFFWSQGGNFDEPILSHAYRAVNMRAPWKFHNSRDTRTAYHYGRRRGFNEFTFKRKGTYHNALDDAKHQAMVVHRATRAIG